MVFISRTRPLNLRSWLKRDSARTIYNLLVKIANRAYLDFNLDYTTALMDVEFVHEVSPLNLEKFLEFDGDNFAHDIYGIYNNMNRDTKTLENCFVPRCTLQTGLA